LGLTAKCPALLLVLVLLLAAKIVSAAGRLFFGGACSCIGPGSASDGKLKLLQLGPLLLLLLLLHMLGRQLHVSGITEDHQVLLLLLLLLLLLEDLALRL
jgi:hypothetical protein